MRNIKITTLVENSVTAGLAPLLAEHGLSFFVEIEDRKILFDTGQGHAILGNADLLGIDLCQVDTVVLSHGHFDHAGGVKHLLGRNNNFTLIAQPGVFGSKLAGGNDNYVSIGVKEDKAVLENSGIRIKLEKDPVEIASGIIATGCIPMNTSFEEVEKMFFVGEEGKETPDDIPDDRALILDTAMGTVVVFGCAHRGPVNTLNHVADLTGSRKIHAVLGGLHLMFADDKKLKEIFKYFHDFEIEKFVIGHCTGFKATAALVNEFGDRVVPNTVGHVIEF